MVGHHDDDEKNNADCPASPSEKEIKDATFGGNFDPLLPEEGEEGIYITTEGGETLELRWFYPKDRIWGGQITYGSLSTITTTHLRTRQLSSSLRRMMASTLSGEFGKPPKVV